jgi:acetyltransferase-like isoleucine patch superfamily enzyme
MGNMKYGLLLKVVDRTLRLPLRTWHYVQECLKKENCTVGKDVHLYPSSRIENLQARKSAIEIGTRTHIRGELLVFAHGGNVRIGESCFVGEDSRIWSASLVSIGDRVFISHGVNIHDNNSHSVSAALRFRHFQQIVSTGHPSTLEDVLSAPVVIGDDVWIGFNSTILKGVTIGQGAIIGAASLVVHDVPAYTIVAGTPARVIGNSRP